MGTRKTKVTLHGILLYISEDHLGFFFSQFGEVADVSSIKSKAVIGTGDVETLLTYPMYYMWRAVLFMLH